MLRKITFMDYPFAFGSATYGELFTDREIESERLMMNFRNGINTILISPRRWGKTSLVIKTAEKMHDKSIKIVRFDTFSCRNEEEFYQLFATEIIRQTSSKINEWVDHARQFLSSLVPRINVGVSPETEFSVTLDFSDKQAVNEVLSLPEKIAIKKKIRVVVCIDEFQQIAGFSDSLNFQKRLRSFWQLQNSVTYCLYGSKKHVMTKLFSRQSMPFYKFGDLMFLQKIDRSNWVKFIVGRFKKTGKSVSAKIAGQICDSVDNHSHYVQQLSWLVWAHTTKIAGDEEFRKAEEELMTQNSMLFYRYIEELSAYQLNFLRAVAEGNHDQLTKKAILNKYNLGTSANVSRLKSALENKELIDIEMKKVTISDPVFCKWIRKELCK